MQRKNNLIIKSLAFTLCALLITGCGQKEQVSVTDGPIVVENDISQDQSIAVEQVSSLNNNLTDDEAEGEESEAEQSEDEIPEEAESENASGQEEATETVAPVSVTPGSVTSVALNPNWLYADFSKINTGSAVLYSAPANRKNIVIGLNPGHGTKGGTSVKTYCHPDMSPKVTGGTTAAGATTAVAVSAGMSFSDGTSEAVVALKTAQILRDMLLADGYDVLMLRDDADVQLDNIARTVIGNNMANCIISLHWDGDSLNYDKGCFYISTPDGIKGMEPVASHWQQHEALGQALINGLQATGCKIYKGGSMDIDLTQTSFSTVASVDIELGNAASAHDDGTLTVLAGGLLKGIESVY